MSYNKETNSSRTERVIVAVIAAIILMGFTIVSILYFPIFIYIVFSANALFICTKYIIKAWYGEEEFSKKFEKHNKK